MADDADNMITKSSGRPWPRTVAGLAVAAHISVALVLWRVPKPIDYANDHHTEISLSILLAQANLLTVWLIVGSGPVIRRLGWTLCGWSGIIFVLATAESLQSAASSVFVIQIAVTGALIAILRLWRPGVILPPVIQTATEESRLTARQFSIIELFGAALGVAIAAAMLTRIDVVATVGPLRRSEMIQALVAVSLPAAAITFLSIMGLRGNSWLGAQVITAGVLLLLALALQIDPHWEWNGLFEIHGAHWFVVAAMLWVFQMCGYRLVRTPPPQSTVE